MCNHHIFVVVLVRASIVFSPLLLIRYSSSWTFSGAYYMQMGPRCLYFIFPLLFFVFFFSLLFFVFLFGTFHRLIENHLPLISMTLHGHTTTATLNAYILQRQQLLPDPADSLNMIIIISIMICKLHIC